MSGATAPDQVPAAEELTVTISPMRRRHLRSVMHIERAVNARPWSENLFAGELEHPPETRAYVVASAGSPVRSVVGYAGLMLVAEDAHVTTISVSPRWQRHKIATRMLLVLAREARRREVRNLTLEVRVGNEAAQGLYRAFGFAPAGIRKGYYPDNGEDALVMWANDIDTPEYAARLDAIAAAVPGTTVVEELPR